MYTVKISFNDETRRLRLSNESLNFLNLRATISELLPALKAKNYSVKWQDDEVGLACIYGFCVILLLIFYRTT